MRDREHCVDVLTADNVTIIDLEGEIDIYTATDFKKALLSSIDAGAKRVVIDLTKVRFIDSMGLSVLVSGQRELRPKGGSLAIACGPRIRRLLTITGLESAFAMYETRDGALSALFDGVPSDTAVTEKVPDQL